MRVVFYSHMAQLGNGGTESLLGLVKGLSKIHDCCVITPYDGDLNMELERLNIKHKTLPFKWSSNVNNNLNPSKIRISLKLIKKWFSDRCFNKKKEALPLKFLNEFQPDLVYSNTSVINIGVTVAGILRIPHVWHIREFQFYDITPNFGYKCLTKYLNKSDAIIVNSKTLKSYYEQFIDAHKIKVIFNGIEPPNMFQEEEYDVTITPRFKFLMVGSLIDIKSHLEALQAVNKLKLRNNKFELHIVGEGRLRPEIEVYIKENALDKYVVLHGHHKNVAHFYNTANCYLMCSKLESFGRVTVEAMYHGLPVIGKKSKINATKELVRDEVDGLLYMHTAELVDKMEWMINNMDEAIEMGVSGKERAENNFSLNRCINQIEEVLSSYSK